MSVLHLLWFLGYDNVFKHLRSLQGTNELRCHFIRNVQNEAVRFKKQALVLQLEEFMRSQANSVQSASKQKLSGATEMTKIRVSNKCNDGFGGFHWDPKKLQVKEMPVFQDCFKYCWLWRTGCRHCLSTGSALCPSCEFPRFVLWWELVENFTALLSQVTVGQCFV